MPGPDHVQETPAVAAPTAPVHQGVATPFGVAMTPTRVLALQRTAGNQRVTEWLQGAMLQRSILDSGAAAALALEAVALLPFDPSRAVGMLANVAWDDMPDAIKARVLNELLDVAATVVRNAPSPAMEVSALWGALRQAALGFLSQVRLRYSDAQKVRVVARLISLWSNPSGSFSSGFLLGLALGLWDGVSGPFVLMWDLVEFEGRIVELQTRLLTQLAHDDSRREVIAAARAAYERVAPLARQAMAELTRERTNAVELLRLVQGLIDAAVTQAARGAGAMMADALMRELMTAPDNELGQALGRIEGNLIFEALLLVLTDGGYTALKEALQGVRWIEQALQRANELRNAARATEAAQLLTTSLARFGAFVRQSRVLAPIAEALGEVWNLIVRFLRMSYGLEGGAERAGGRVVSVEAETLEEGVRMMRELPSGGRLKLLETGRIVVCHSPCMYIEQRFARELAGPTGAAYRARLDQIRVSEQTALAAGDRVAEENAFQLADALNTELENVRLAALRGVSGLNDTVLRELLLEANDNGPRVEMLLRDANSDPNRVRQLLQYCGRDESRLERMMEAADRFRAPRTPAGAPMHDARLAPFHPNAQANVPHFLDEHTYEYFDINQLGDSPFKSFWPPGTTRADIEAALLEALEQLRAEGRLGPTGTWWTRKVDLPSRRMFFQVGSNPTQIGQFFPITGAGLETYLNEELRVIARLFGR